MELDDLVERDGEQPVGKRLAQNRLVGEGQKAHVFERPDVGGRHAALVELLAVPGNPIVGPGNLLFELGELNLADALARCRLDLAIENGHGREI